jgi:hypothetical protein
MARPAGILPSGCAGGLRGFADSTSCADVELARIPASHPYGAFPPPIRRAIGARVEQRAPSAHSSEKPDQEQERSHSRAMLCCGCCFSASSPSAGHDGPLLYRGPLRGGDPGSTGRAAGVAMDGNAFSRGHDARSKSPAPAHGLAAQGWAASAKRGVVFSWLLLFWTSKREVTRAPQAHESSCS